jgi:hypothetical protein
VGTVTKLQIANLALSLIGSKRITTFGETTTEEGREINATYSFIRDEVLMEHPWSFAQKRAALVDMTRTDQDDWVTGTDYAVDDIVYDPTLAKYYICLVAHTSAALFATDLAAVNWELYTDWLTSTVYDKGDKVYNSGVEYACLVNHSSGTFATDLTALKWVATETITSLDDELTNVFYLPTDFLRYNRVSDEDAAIEIVGNRLLADTDTLSIKYTYSNDDPTLYSPMFVTALASRLAAEMCFNLTQSANKAKDILTKYESIDLPRAMAADSSQGSPEEMTDTEWEEARIT